MPTPEVTRADSLELLLVTPERNYFSADGNIFSPDGIIGPQSPMPHSNSLFASVAPR